MGLVRSGIDGVRVFELPAGVWADGAIVTGPRVCLVRWHSTWIDKLHQVYVNGKFAGATIDCGQRQIVVQVPSCYERAARIEVFAVKPSDADVNFGDEFGENEGNIGRVKLSFLRSQRLPAGARFEVYSGKGSNGINYGNPVGTGQIWGYRQDKAGFGLSRFGEGDFGYEWAAGVGFGKGSLGLGEFGADADVIEWTSPVLEAGVYKFGVKVIDEKGNESAASETGEVTVIPAAKPASGINVSLFDKERNTLVIGVHDNR
jgi:hypothetical protein